MELGGGALLVESSLEGADTAKPVAVPRAAGVAAGKFQGTSKDLKKAKVDKLEPEQGWLWSGSTVPRLGWVLMVSYIVYAVSNYYWPVNGEGMLL